MFLLTFRCGNSAKSWNTMPMPALRRHVSPGPGHQLAVQRISPRLTGSKPAMARSSVVLPQPLGPSKQPILPGSSGS
jgi:hypothetical protein